MPLEIAGKATIFTLGTGLRSQEDFMEILAAYELRPVIDVNNMAARSRLRTSIKKVLNAVGAGQKDEAVAALKAAQPVLDTMVTKGSIHRNKAARHKRELNAQVKALAAK